MLPESRLYSFIDSGKKYALRFLEGQKLISDLATIHPIQSKGFSYFRDLVLSSQPLVAFLKGKEHFGFYIESKTPEFLFKIETNQLGLVRCLLLPENFNKFPSHLNGIARVVKISPQQKTPYQSIVELRNTPLHSVMNQVLAQSYQIQAVILISEKSDQSIMLHQLPSLDPNSQTFESTEGLEACMDTHRSGFLEIFEKSMTDSETIQHEFASLGFQLLAGKDIKFQCNCSKEDMVQKILTLSKEDQDQLFELGETTLEVVCEYCKTKRLISKDDLNGRVSLPS